MRGPQRAPLGVSAERYRLYCHPAHMVVWRASAQIRWGVWMWLLMGTTWLVGYLGADPMGGVVTLCIYSALAASKKMCEQREEANLTRLVILTRSAAARGARGHFRGLSLS